MVNNQHTALTTSSDTNNPTLGKTNKQTSHMNTCSPMGESTPNQQAMPGEGDCQIGGICPLTWHVLFPVGIRPPMAAPGGRSMAQLLVQGDGCLSSGPGLSC